MIGAMGDSLTAGNGIFATNLLHVTVENRGVVWSIGGQYDWRKYLTLPNILKEFNPNLYGYAINNIMESLLKFVSRYFIRILFLPYQID